MIIWGTEVYAVFSEYVDSGKTAIVLMESATCCPFCTVTVNVPKIELAEDEVLAKTWSENDIVYKELIRNGFLIPTGLTVECGFSDASICKVNREIK